MKSLHVDDFTKYNTCTLLGSKQPTEMEKERIFKVIEYIASTSTPNIAIPHSDQLHNLIVDVIKNTKVSNLSKKYDLLKSQIEGCETNESLLMNVAQTYGLTPKSLLMETIAIHSRIKELDNKDAWFDNFSLNNFLLQLTTIVYSEYDKSSDPFVKSLVFHASNNMSGGESSETNHELTNNVQSSRDLIYDLEIAQKTTKSMSGGQSPHVQQNAQCPKINSSIKLTNPTQLLFHLGNNYRTFIEFGIPADQVKDNDKAVEFLDALNQKYPYYTGCTHGCDVFTPDFRDKSVSIQDIYEFCQRYPYSIVGYILNTKTYASGKGQHWMALIFKHSTVYLICSQSSGFNAFEEKTLEQDLEKCGFVKEWNTKTIQIDHSSCGLYSVLSNLSFIINGGGDRKPNISTIVDMIGKDAKGINNKGIYLIKKKLAGYKS